MTTYLVVDAESSELLAGVPSEELISYAGEVCDASFDSVSGTWVLWNEPIRIGGCRFVVVYGMPDEGVTE